MYLVVRTYEHTDPSYGEEGFRRVREDLLPVLSEMDGFVSYCSAYDPDRGTVTSVSIYWTREAAEEANRAAVEWCGYASDHERRHGGKPWRYVLIPHDAVEANRTLAGLTAQFTVK